LDGLAGCIRVRKARSRGVVSFVGGRDPGWAEWHRGHSESQTPGKVQEDIVRCEILIAPFLQSCTQVGCPIYSLTVKKEKKGQK
jgi:hypothetical protein